MNLIIKLASCLRRLAYLAAVSGLYCQISFSSIMRESESDMVPSQSSNSGSRLSSLRDLSLQALSTIEEPSLQERLSSNYTWQDLNDEVIEHILSQGVNLSIFKLVSQLAYKQARKFAALNGDPSAQYYLGIKLNSSNNTEDQAQGKIWIQKAVLQGHPEACALRIDLASPLTEHINSNILSLNSECVLYLFSFLSPNELSKMMLVCKQWKEVAEDPAVWKRHARYLCIFNEEPHGYQNQVINLLKNDDHSKNLYRTVTPSPTDLLFNKQLEFNEAIFIKYEERIKSFMLPNEKSFKGFSADFKSLNLLNSEVGNEDFNNIWLKQSPSNLTALNLENCCLDAMGLQALKSISLKTLSILYLYKNKIGDEGAWLLREMKFPALTALSLRETNLGAEGFKALVGYFPNLTWLNLDQNNIGAEGISAISASNFPALTYLNLSRNDLQDKGIEALVSSKFPALNVLALSNNAITDVGVKDLVKGAEHFPVLNNLRLEENKIEDEGARMLATSNFITLNRLDLSDNDIGLKGSRILQESNIFAIKMARIRCQKWDNEIKHALKESNFNSVPTRDFTRVNLRELFSLYTPQELLDFIDRFPDTAAYEKLLKRLKHQYLNAWLDVAYNKYNEFAERQLSKSFDCLRKLKGTFVEKKYTKLLLQAFIKGNAHLLSIVEIEQFNRQGFFSSCTPQELSDFIYKFPDTSIYTQLSADLRESLINNWLDAAKGNLRTFEGEDFSGSIHGLFETRNLANKEKFKDFLHKMFKVSEVKLSNFTPEHLASLILELGKILGNTRKIPLSFFEAWFQSAYPKLEDFNEQRLTNSLYGLSLLARQPPVSFLEKWYKCTQIHLGDFTPHGLSSALYAIACLGIKPPKEFLYQWTEHSLAKLKDFPTQSLAVGLYALALLEQDLCEEFLIKLKMECSQLDIMADTDPKNAHLLYLVARHYKVDCPHSIRLKSFILNQPTPISSFQSEVMNYIQQIFPEIEFESEYWIEDLYSCVDIAIPSRRMIIEVDGIHHFIRTINNTHIRKSQDRLRDRILHELGWKVIRISYRDFQGTEQAKINYISKILKELKSSYKC
ncbi:MAG: F-box-like domain-containing protein [Alphaproteobacteria bacterium]|nr:F-box-like domain-containing protein [Alphaproteobacteria bacterium]